MQPGTVDLAQIVNLSSFLGVGALGLLIGMVIQAIKPLLNPKMAVYIPIVSWAVGIFFSLLIGFGLGLTNTNYNIVALVLLGWTSGATSSGLYEATIEKLFPSQKLSLKQPPVPPTPPTTTSFISS